MKTEWLDSLKVYYKNNPEKLKNVTGNDCHCVQLLNCLLHHGPHGKHFVMVFEILGVNLLEVIKRYNYKGAPLPLVRIMAKQCLMALDYLHRVCKIIHTDLKPENVNLCLTDKEVQEIAEKGQLTTTKMYHQPAEIKALSSAQALVDPKSVRGRGNQEDAAQQRTDKQAKRNEKKKKQKQKKKEQMKQQQMNENMQTEEDINHNTNSNNAQETQGKKGKKKNFQFQNKNVTNNNNDNGKTQA